MGSHAHTICCTAALVLVRPTAVVIRILFMLIAGVELANERASAAFAQDTTKTNNPTRCNILHGNLQKLSNITALGTDTNDQRIPLQALHGLPTHITCLTLTLSGNNQVTDTCHPLEPINQQITHAHLAADPGGLSAAPEFPTSLSSLCWSHLTSGTAAPTATTLLPILFCCTGVPAAFGTTEPPLSFSKSFCSAVITCSQAR